MKFYQHILVASGDNQKSSKEIINSTKSLAEPCNSKVGIIHSMPNLNSNSIGYALPSAIDIESQLVDSAKEKLHKLLNQLTVSEKYLSVEKGPIKRVVSEQAKQRQVDLLVIGKHKRHAMDLLTPPVNTMLHHTDCDILAVHIPDY